MPVPPDYLVYGPTEGEMTRARTMEMRNERTNLCRRLVEYSDDIHCFAVHRDLAKDRSKRG